MPNFEFLRGQMKDCKKKLRALTEKAEADGRDLNATETAAYEVELMALKEIEKSIERRQDMLDWESRRGFVAPVQLGSAKSGQIDRAAGVPIEVLRQRLEIKFPAD